MVSQHPLQTLFEVPSITGRASCCAKCRDEVIAAEKEMGAFVIAVRDLYGKLEASRAAEDWVELAEDIEGPLIDGYPNWRHITVAAASQLAKRRTLDQNPAHDRREKWQMK
jgi:hypothetical protein